MLQCSVMTWGLQQAVQHGNSVHLEKGASALASLPWTDGDVAARQAWVTAGSSQMCAGEEEMHREEQERERICRQFGYL